MNRCGIIINGTIIYLMLFAFVLSAAAADSFIQADRDRLTRIEATQNAPSPIGEGLGWGFK